MKDSTVKIDIKIEGKTIAGYEFFVDGKLVLWEDMDRKQQVSVLNSLIQGYGLFKKF